LPGLGERLVKRFSFFSPSIWWFIGGLQMGSL
jgi:hypothetical protein